MRFLRDTWILFSHNVRMTLRNPVWVFLGVFNPVLYLLLFAPLLDPLTNAPGFPAGGGLEVFTPAALVMIGMFGATFVGFGLIAQLRAGEIERLRVTPASRLALLMGSVLRDVAQLLVQAALLVVIALLLGLELENVAGVGMALVMLGLMGLLLASCSYALALTLKDENSFSSTLQFFLAPLMLLSGILLPLTLAPDWLRTVAAFNPLAYSVDAVRALFAGRLGDSEVLQGFAILIPLTVLALWWAARSYRKAIS
jgi:ABC-2 type transport system permease protein